MTCSSPSGPIRSTTRRSRRKWRLFATVVSTRTSDWSGSRPTSSNRRASSFGSLQSIFPSYCFGLPGPSFGGPVGSCRLEVAQVRVRTEPGDKVASQTGYRVEDLLLRVEAVAYPVGDPQIGKPLVQVDNLLEVKIHARVFVCLTCRKVRGRLRGVDPKRSAASGSDDSKDRYFQSFFRPSCQRGKESIQAPRLRRALRQEAAIEHADNWLLRMASNTKSDQIEPDPLEPPS